MHHRITITLPSEIHLQLKNQVTKGEHSKFITEAIKKALMEKRLLKNIKDPFLAISTLRKKMPRHSEFQINKALKWGRS
jgi:metal-responsive CopG/Arc/MetJ family transcriptional regulator